MWCEHCRVLQPKAQYFFAEMDKSVKRLQATAAAVASESFYVPYVDTDLSKVRGAAVRTLKRLHGIFPVPLN